ncbi:MAG: vitamin K epoxide reductase family protein [bacterium]
MLKKRTSANWALLSPAIAGMALAAYMTYTAWAGAELAFCGEGGGCDLVQKSRWGTFLGIPTSVLGFGLYLALAWVALRVRNPVRHWAFAWTLSLIGVAYSLYLTVISQTVIEATCPYCLGSLGILLVMLVIVAFQRPPGLAAFNWFTWGGQTAIVAVALVAGMHFYYSGWVVSATGPEDPYLKGLAIHLKDSGAIFYGAYW